MTPAMRFSIVIATYKRANLLKDTLESLARLRPSGPWEVIVVDNNSPDNTREVVAAAVSFLVRLHSRVEKEQGRSAALNCGFQIAQARSSHTPTCAAPDWLDHIELGSRRAVRLRRRARGRGERNRRDGSRAPTAGASVIALLDYGPDAIRLALAFRSASNMAMRRRSSVPAASTARIASRHPARTGSARPVHGSDAAGWSVLHPGDGGPASDRGIA
jgi:hypothetical protein